MMKKYLLILFVVIVSVICMYGKGFASVLFAKNTTVYLTPQPPFEIQDSDILFSVQPHQEYWIYFQPNGNGYVDFDVLVDSNVLTEQVKVNSLTMIVEDLDITVTKSNLDLPIKIKKHSNMTKKYHGWMDFRHIILTNDIVNEYNKQHKTSLNSMELFNKFNVNDVKFVIDLSYVINRKKYSSMLTFKYKPRRVTSNRVWDMFMSV